MNGTDKWLWRCTLNVLFGIRLGDAQRSYFVRPCEELVGSLDSSGCGSFNRSLPLSSGNAFFVSVQLSHARRMDNCLANGTCRSSKPLACSDLPQPHSITVLSLTDFTVSLGSSLKLCEPHEQFLSRIPTVKTVLVLGHPL